MCLFNEIFAQGLTDVTFCDKILMYSGTGINKCQHILFGLGLFFGKLHAVNYFTTKSKFSSKNEVIKCQTAKRVKV